MTLPLTDNLADLAEMIGPLPPGDTPAAWWYSIAPEVLAGWDAFQRDHKAWRNRMDKLYRISGLPKRTRHANRAESIRVSSLGDAYLVGLVPPRNMGAPPRWWRLNKQGILVPRRYTLMEKNSEVNKLFGRCREIPSAVRYVPGMPDTLWTYDKAYPVHLRRPGDAVLAFVGWPPAGASPEFTPDPSLWTELKLSTWHLLKERQLAGSQSA
jgi:hypothetical protein